MNVPNADGDTNVTCNASDTNTCNVHAESLIVRSCQLMIGQDATSAAGTLHMMMLPTHGATPVLALATNNLLGSSDRDFFYPVVPLISFSVDHDARSVVFPRLLCEGNYCLLAPRKEDIGAIHAELLAWGCVVKVKEKVRVSELTAVQRAYHVTVGVGGVQSPRDGQALVDAPKNVIRSARMGTRGVVSLTKELVEGIDSAARAMNAETDSVVSCTRASPRSLQGPTKAKAVGSSLRRAANDLFSAPPRSTGHSSILAHELTRDHIHFAGQLLHGVCTRVVDHRAAKDGTGRGEELCLGVPSRQMSATRK